MPDLIDIILDRLSLSSLDYLDKIDLENDRKSRFFFEDLQDSLKTVEDACINRYINELNCQTELFISKTRKYKSILDKFKKQFAGIQSMENTNDNIKKIKTYTHQIQNLQKQLSEITQGSSELGPDELFTQINETYKSIEELELKNEELKDKLKCYQDFPPNMREAHYCISDLKERIKKKEALLESNFYRKNFS